MATTQTLISLFRKMSLSEAEKTLAAMQIQPPIKGSHRLKHFSTSLEKARAFHNKAVAAPETIIEIQFETSKFDAIIRQAVQQEGASQFPDKVQISVEGLTAEQIASGHMNIGIPQSLLEVLNQAVASMKEVA